MAIQFGFRADEVTASTPDGDNVRICDGRLSNKVGTLSYDSGPTALPVTDADNRVQFAMTGRASNTCNILMTLRTRHRFRFRPTESGRLTASAFYTPGLVSSIVCAGEQDIFNLFDKAGPVTFNVFVRLAVRVFASSGATVLDSPGQWRNVFSTSLDGRSFPVSRSESFAPELMDVVESRSFGTLVLPSDTVRVDARYLVQGLAIDDSGFVADAASGGLGLNVPMTVIRVDP